MNLVNTRKRRWQMLSTTPRGSERTEARAALVIAYLKPCTCCIVPHMSANAHACRHAKLLSSCTSHALKGCWLGAVQVGWSAIDG